jgi:hypothetical protein
MRSTCHSLLCRYLLLLATVLGYLSLQTSAAAIGPHSSGPSSDKTITHDGGLAARSVSSSDRLKEFFERPLYNIRTGSTRRSGLFDSAEDQDESGIPYIYITSYSMLCLTRLIGLIFKKSLLPAFVTEGDDLTPSLPQDVTNGRSLLGTKQARQIRRQEAESAVAAGIQDTGLVTRKYKFTINYADVGDHDPILLHKLTPA